MTRALRGRSRRHGRSWRRRRRREPTRFAGSFRRSSRGRQTSTVSGALGTESRRTSRVARTELQRQVAELDTARAEADAERRIAQAEARAARWRTRGSPREWRRSERAPRGGLPEPRSNSTPAARACVRRCGRWPASESRRRSSSPGRPSSGSETPSSGSMSRWLAWRTPSDAWLASRTGSARRRAAWARPRGRRSRYRQWDARMRSASRVEEEAAKRIAAAEDRIRRLLRGESGDS